MPTNPFKNIPSVSELLESEPLKKVVDKVSHNVVVTEVRSFLDNLREDIRDATSDVNLPAPKDLAEKIAEWIETDQQPKLRPVINATGIMLHTGLGRAPLPDEAIQEIVSIASGYASVEVDLESGNRSQRVQSVTKLLCEVTGAEAAAIANNNAGATMLTLAALGCGKEIIVSRGHLVEIGGSYRLPDVMTVSGATLREVGTTNKTRIADYENAIDETTGALMRVHTSNYIINGFTQEASLRELISAGKEHNIPVIDDIGSGALVDFSKYGIEGEPMARDSIAAGSDVVLFSGDKLLGGPQAGIIVGKKKYINMITKHPMMRALRVDKITLAALAATLKLYRDEATAESSVPLLALLSASVDNLKNRAERLAPQLQAVDCVAEAEPAAGECFLGGGSVPTQRVDTYCVAIRPSGLSIDALAKALRTGEHPVFPRVQQDRLWIDLRSVFPKQDSQIVDAFNAVGKTEA